MANYDFDSFDKGTEQYDFSAFDKAVEAPVTSIPAAPSITETILRGGAQGATLGFADELTALLRSALSKDLSYEEAREQERAKYEAAEEENPLSSLVGNIGGAIVTAPLMPGVSGATVAARMASLAKAGAAGGALAGLGTSKADLLKGEEGKALQDIAEGAVVGGVAAPALGLVGEGVVNAVKSVGGLARKQSFGQELEETLKRSYKGEELYDVAEAAAKESQLLGEEGVIGLSEKLRKDIGRAKGDVLKSQEQLVDISTPIEEALDNAKQQAARLYESGTYKTTNLNKMDIQEPLQAIEDYLSGVLGDEVIYNPDTMENIFTGALLKNKNTEEIKRRLEQGALRKVTEAAAEQEPKGVAKYLEKTVSEDAKELRKKMLADKMIDIEQAPEIVGINKQLDDLKAVITSKEPQITATQKIEARNRLADLNKQKKYEIAKTLTEVEKNPTVAKAAEELSMWKAKASAEDISDIERTSFLKKAQDASVNLKKAKIDAKEQIKKEIEDKVADEIASLKSTIQDKTLVVKPEDKQQAEEALKLLAIKLKKAKMQQGFSAEDEVDNYIADNYDLLKSVAKTKTILFREPAVMPPEIITEPATGLRVAMVERGAEPLTKAISEPYIHRPVTHMTPSEIDALASNMYSRFKTKYQEDPVAMKVIDSFVSKLKDTGMSSITDEGVKKEHALLSSAYKSIKDAQSKLGISEANLGSREKYDQVSNQIKTLVSQYHSKGSDAHRKLNAFFDDLAKVDEAQANEMRSWVNDYSMHEHLANVLMGTSAMTGELKALYTTPKAWTGLLARQIGKTAKAATEAGQNVLTDAQHLYNMTPESVQKMVSFFSSKGPGGQKLATLMGNALNAPLSKRKAVIFTMMQQPAYREMIDSYFNQE